MIPIITIDGPSGSGKGTIASLLAERLGWEVLDSGALYRLVGYAAGKSGIGFDQVDNLCEIARNMHVMFKGDQLFLDGEEVSRSIRTEVAGNAASKVAAIPEVRAALLEWQRSFAREPGLVADGRDMGSVVFPDADVKVFLTASAEERANRRHNQLKEKGISVSLRDLVRDIRERDERDQNRDVAPLIAPVAALEVESTSLSIDEVLEQVLGKVRTAFPDLCV
ncbi:MAG: (d)CMP kinase [Gammaproteobacteria bacterium]|nr:(d)CMP kinase [Gammaproteobacteria bacterium]